MTKWSTMAGTIPDHYTSLFHRLGAGGRPPLGAEGRPLFGGLGEPIGGGAGRIGKDMTFCPLDVLATLADRGGCAGREGVDAEPLGSEGF
jgi:hypothetical protein